MIHVTYKYGENNWIEMDMPVSNFQDLDVLMHYISEAPLKVHDNVAHMEYTCKPIRVEYILSF